MAHLSASPFTDWTTEKAQQALEEAKHDLQESNAKFADGDHWQDGDAWIGPHLAGSDVVATQMWDEIERGFTSRNVIAEVTDRHVGGVLGQESRFGFVVARPLKEDENPSDEEVALIREIEAAVTPWWDKRRARQQLQRALASALLSTRGDLRLYFAKGQLAAFPVVGGVRQVKATTLPEALEMIWLEFVGPDLAAVVEDPDTKLEAGVLIHEVSGNKQVELVFLEPSTTAPTRSMVRRVVDAVRGGTSHSPTPRTIVRSIADQQSEDVPLQLGGRLTMAEVRRKLLITPQVQQLQKALNLALSMIPHNLVEAGFLETTILNGQMPGELVDDPDIPGKKRLIPGPYQRGATTVNWISGLNYEDKDGNQQLATPSIQYRDPVEVTAPVAAKTDHYADILHEVDQEHILIASEATPSGRSREQAREDYVASLGESQAAVEPVGQWLIETVVAMAEALMGQPGKYTSRLRATFECRLNKGPISTEDRAQNMAEVKEGALDLESAMERNGVADVQATLSRIASRPEHRLALVKQQAETLKALQDAAIDLETALELAAFEPEQITKIMNKSGFEDPDADPDDERDEDERPAA